MYYETVVGLEVHVGLDTKSKLFCGCTTAFGGDPNTQVCPVCMGLPGSLPVLNKAAVEYALRVGLTLGCSIEKQSEFDRKNYYYPDLPKAYQISQLYTPICRGGGVEICVDGKIKRIGIHEIHIEEDAGKSVHDLWDDATLLDYNRCGTPLLEIVSRADFRDSKEVVAYLEKLKEILIYLGVSDCKMQEGSMRADVNLSIMPKGSTQFGVRVEMKNMNSFKFIKRAVEFESKRQAQVLDSGGAIVQETRRWDPNKDMSFSMRGKENAQDYRYFREPDLLVVDVSDEWINRVRDNLPELAQEKRDRYVERYGLSNYDAQEITAYKEIADFFERTIKICDKPKEVANMIMVEVMRLISVSGSLPENFDMDAEKFANLIELISSGKVNRNVGKEIVGKIFYDNIDPIKYIEENGLIVLDDLNLIKETIEVVLRDNPQSVLDFKSGKDKAFGFIVGQTMRKLGGKANPELINSALKKELDKM